MTTVEYEQLEPYYIKVQSNTFWRVYKDWAFKNQDCLKFTYNRKGVETFWIEAEFYKRHVRGLT